MNKITSRISLVVAIAVAVAVSSVNAQSVTYYEGELGPDGLPHGFAAGDFAVTTAGGAAGVFIAGAPGGADPPLGWTENCLSTFCNGEENLGTDGQTYSVILGYSPGPMENQWLFFNIFGTEGVDTTDAIFANVPGLTPDDVSTFSMGYGSTTGIPDFDGTVMYVPAVPEPSSASLLGIALLAGWGMIRRR